MNNFGEKMKTNERGQGLVDILLILALILIVAVIVADIRQEYNNREMPVGTVVCADKEYYGEVNLNYSKQYVITTESGQEIIAPRPFCIYISDPS